MSVPRSIARAAMAQAKQANPRRRPTRQLEERDGDVIRTINVYRIDEHLARRTVQERSVRGARLTCCVCGAEAIKDQRSTYCTRCGEGSGLTISTVPAPSRARHI